MVRFGKKAGTFHQVPAFRLLIGVGAHFFEPLKNGIQAVRVNHEFLETFHASLGHFRRGVTIKELGQSRVR